jgi:hypothetical protein
MDSFLSGTIDDLWDWWIIYFKSLLDLLWELHAKENIFTEGYESNRRVRKPYGEELYNSYPSSGTIRMINQRVRDGWNMRHLLDKW